MEVISLESEAFKELIYRIDRIESYVERTTLLLNDIDEDLEMTTKDLMNLLSVSESTLYRWRKKNLLLYKYNKSGDIRFYYKSLLASISSNKLHISGISNSDIILRLKKYKDNIILNACLNFKER